LKEYALKMLILKMTHTFENALLKAKEEMGKIKSDILDIDG